MHASASEEERIPPDAAIGKSSPTARRISETFAIVVSSSGSPDKPPDPDARRGSRTGRVLERAGQLGEVRLVVTVAAPGHVGAAHVELDRIDVRLEQLVRLARRGDVF